jgi:hypothetical protein
MFVIKFQSQIVSSKSRQRAGFEQKTLVAQIVGQICDARRLQGGKRPVRLAVHQVDDRQTRRDLCPRSTLEPIVDLVLEQFSRLVE